MAELYVNNVRGTLASPITTSDTSIALESGHNFPDPGANWYRATLFRRDFTAEGIVEYDHEVVRVTGLTGDTLTVERAFEGGPYAYDPGEPIEHRLTAGVLDDIWAEFGDVGTLLDDINGEEA